MRIVVEVDRDLCIGSGNCVYEAPGVFELDGDSVAFVLDPEAAPEDAVIAAMRKCPSRAISVRLDDVTPA
jgi:ferredoxin